MLTTIHFDPLGVPERDVATTDRAAMIIAKSIYGGVTPDSAEWRKCIQAVELIQGCIPMEQPQPGNKSVAAMQQCATFNNTYRIGTEGVITEQNGAKVTCTVQKEAMVFPNNLGDAVVLAWFSTLGWRNVEQFTILQKETTVAQELTAIGQQARGREKPELAETLYKAAIQADPNYFHVYNEYAVLLNSQQRIEEAMKMWDRALEVNPESPEVRSNLAMVLRALGEPGEAEKHCDEALRWAPGNDAILLNAAGIYDDVGRTDDAIRIIEQVKRRHPEKIHLKHNLALVNLSAGRLEEGWKTFDARLSQPHSNMHYEHYNIPRWTGAENPDGKEILVWGDQGLGDEIMTASMVPDLIDAGAKVTLLVNNRLVPLMRRSFPGIAVGERTTSPTATLIRAESMPPEFMPAVMHNKTFDYQASQSDLGVAFRSSVDKFPKHNGFLTANPDEVAKIRDALMKCCRGPKFVGISWDSSRNVTVGRLKSISLEQLRPILEVPGVTFVNLQYGYVSGILQNFYEETGIRIVEFPEVDQLLNMDRFASLVAALDMVVSCSNTTVHVAGALNVPTMVLTPMGPGKIWYWFRDRTDSPWYPSLKLYRQEAATKWNSAIVRVANDLYQWAQK